MLNRFSGFVHWQILQKICSKVIVKDPTSPHTHRYTLLTLPCETILVTNTSPTTAAESIEVPFGLLTRVVTSKHVLGGGREARGGAVFWARAYSGLLKSTGNIRREPKLLFRWQQRCGLSLSVMWRLVSCISSSMRIGLLYMIRSVSATQLRPNRYCKQWRN